MTDTQSTDITIVWTYDSHTPGYLSDSDDRPLFFDRADAVAALVFDLTRWADDLTCDSWDLNGCAEGGCSWCDDVAVTVAAVLTDDGPDAPGFGEGWSASFDYGCSLPRTWDLYPVPIADLTDEEWADLTG